MGLCDEAGAAGLLKESDEGYIRRGQARAVIRLDLIDDASAGSHLQIRTQIDRKETRGIFRDQVRQKTIPKKEQFPWDRIFVSAYGAGRGVSGTGDISIYSVVDAVYNLFNYFEGLQNPELTIRRLMDGGGTSLESSKILKLLAEVADVDNVSMTSTGLVADDSWGKGMPFRDLADGYRSAFTWIADLVGWALAFNPSYRNPEEISGIVLVDEIEQHLHARWQRTAVATLRKIFPRIQFIAATHSPLVASSVGNPGQPQPTDALYVLERQLDAGVSAYPHEFMNGFRMDQVLASRAFKYQVGVDPELDELLSKLSRLTAEGPTLEQKGEYDRVREIFKNHFLRATTPVGQAAEVEAIKDRLEEIRALEAKLFPGDDD